MPIYPSGLNALKETLRAPRASAITFTAPLFAATRLGAENNAYQFSGANAATLANGAPVLGSVNARGITLNTPNMPATGDFAYAFYFRTNQAGASATRPETLLGVAGQTNSGGSGGALQFKSPVIVTGSVSSGQTIDTTNAGRISPRRQGTSWQWWPQTTVGADLAGIALASDTEYLCVLGIKASAGADYPFIHFVRLSDGAVQTATGTTAITGTRPSAALFNLFGALGSGADRQGFGGDVGEFVVMTGAAPTSTQAQAVASGTSLTQLAANVGATIAWRNLLDYSVQSSGTFTSATGANATVLTGALFLENARSFKTSGVLLDRLGARWVFPVAQAGTSGKVWFEGAAPPGASVACFIRYTDGSASPQARFVADGTGRFAGSIVSPIAKPFYRSAGNVADPTDCHHEFDLMDVGYVIPTIGQSEVIYMFSSSWASSSDLTPAASGNTGLASSSGPGASSGPWGAVLDMANRSTTGNQPRRAIGAHARPERLIGRGVWADGVNEMVSRIIADRSASVMLVNVARGGHTVDQFVFDRQPFTRSLTLSGSGTGPYTATITLPTASVQARFGPVGTGALSSTDAANLVVSSGMVHQVRPGTFSLDLGGGVVVTDTRVSDSAGTLSGSGGITGTITYVAGTSTGSATVSITFPSTPASITGTLSWQPKSETLDTSDNNKTANLNGFGVIEALDEIAARGLRYGWSLGLIWWSTANISEARASLVSKYELMRGLLKSYVMAGVDTALADGPLMVCAKGRDTGNSTANIDDKRLMAQELWAGSRSWVVRGGQYYDNALDAATSPHETWTQDSGPRIGRRMGAYAAAWLGGSPIAEPVFRSGAADRTSSTLLTVPLASIGTGLSLVVGSGGNANALDQWYVGGTIIPNDATTIARIRADGQAVELVKLSGTWATGAESNVLYVSGGPGSGATPPASLLYDNRGGFSNEPGLLAAPKLG